MLGDLYIHVDRPQTFEVFSPHLFELLNISGRQTRFSDNAPGGRYDIGRSLGLEIKLMEADSTDHPDYEFWLTFSPCSVWPNIDTRCLIGFADIVARFLAQHGMTIARPLDNRAGAENAIYRPQILEQGH